MNPVYEDKREDFRIYPLCDHPYPPHVHYVVEMMYVTAGSLTVTIADQQVTLNEGDIAIAFPLIFHSYDSVSDDVKGHAFFFSPELVSRYASVFNGNRPAMPVVRAKDMDEKTKTFLKELIQLDQEDYDEAMAEGYMCLLLTKLFPAIKLETLTYKPESETIHKVTMYLSAHYCEDLTLDSVSRALGMSRSHLSHIFSQQLKINFRQYINMFRIGLATRLIREDPARSLMDISYACGFEDVRTFRRAFQLLEGMSPNAYRKNLMSPGSVFPDDDEDDDEE